MRARLRYDFGGSRFQKLMWGAIPLNPTAQMSVMVPTALIRSAQLRRTHSNQVDRATAHASGGHNSAGAAFQAESQGQRARFEVRIKISPQIQRTIQLHTGTRCSVYGSAYLRNHAAYTARRRVPVRRLVVVVESTLPALDCLFLYRRFGCSANRP